MTHRIAASLLDSETGYTALYATDVDESLEPGDVLYMWLDGNWACDCNRSLFLWDWDDNKKLGCNSNEPRIKLARLEYDGKLIAKNDKAL